MTKVRFAVLLLAMLVLLPAGGCAGPEPETPPEPADLRIWVRRPGRGHSEYYSHSGTEAGALLAALEASLTPAEGETMTLADPWYKVVRTLPAPQGYSGDTLVGLWCDGLFLAADGTLYRSDLDLGPLLEPFDLEVQQGYYGPFGNELCRLLGGWQAPLLEAAPDPAAALPQGRILSQTDTGCTVRLEAPADLGLQYPDLHSWLEVQLDGIWYQVPAVFDAMLVNTVSMLPSLGPGEHLDVTFDTGDTARWGTLLPGQYRWSCFRCQWTFTVD